VVRGQETGDSVAGQPGRPAVRGALWAQLSHSRRLRTDAERASCGSTRGLAVALQWKEEGTLINADPDLC
jgi:hypothetical protein